jgi:hypothetical protein
VVGLLPGAQLLTALDLGVFEFFHNICSVFAIVATDRKPT